MSQRASFDLITFPQLEKEESTSVFVLNRSKPRGNINLSVHTRAGMSSVQVPIVNGPIDLTMQAAKNDLIADPNFKRMVARNMIVLVSADSAAAFYETDAGKALNAKIYDAVESADANDLINYPVGEEVGGELDDGMVEGVSPFVLNVVMRANEDGAIVSSLIDELEGQVDTLEAADFDYLVSATSDSELKEWAATAKSLAEL